jgi:hypothetical protein
MALTVLLPNGRPTQSIEVSALTGDRPGLVVEEAISPDFPDPPTAGPADDRTRGREASVKGYLLGLSEGARATVIAKSIREAGFGCPEVRSTGSLSPDGNAWRAYCGDTLLYWIDIDEFGRVSVEPGAYGEQRPERAIQTITTEEVQTLQLK